MQPGWCEISLVNLYLPCSAQKLRMNCVRGARRAYWSYESCWLHPPQSQKRHSCSLLYWSISILWTTDLSLENVCWFAL